MAKHKLNPDEGEHWFNPLSFNLYKIHSLSPDGWVRYQAVVPETGGLLPMVFTMPTLDFVARHKKRGPDDS